MEIAIGGDHAGFAYKEQVIKHLESQGHVLNDFGTHSVDSVDYPDFAHPVASEVSVDDTKRGILICGTGNGVCMTANKYENIRAGLCWNKEVAELIRRHNNANICCIPARFVSLESAIEIIDSFFTTEFEGGRHQRRIGKISSC